MRAVVAAVTMLAGLAVGCADAGTSGAAAQTSLTVKYWSEGPDATRAVTWTLRCGPNGGTHPARARACARLAALERPFAPIPSDAVCTQIFGGPQTALVTGTYRGRRIWTRFSRADGCQIQRWNQHVPLVPSASARR